MDPQHEVIYTEDVCLPGVAPARLLWPFCYWVESWPVLLTEVLEKFRSLSFISCVHVQRCGVSFHPPHPFQCVMVLQDGLSLMAGYCLAFRSWFSNGFQAVE